MRFPEIVCLMCALAGVTLFSSAGAVADAIDGDWCFGTRHLAVNGPDITTPGGTQMKGDYDRHSFSYVVPSGEKDAGQPVGMELRDEDHMTLRQGAGKPQLWKRCRAPTS
jgi:hypothetical protein